MVSRLDGVALELNLKFDPAHFIEGLPVDRRQLPDSPSVLRCIFRELIQKTIQIAVSI